MIYEEMIYEEIRGDDVREEQNRIEEKRGEKRSTPPQPLLDNLNSVLSETKEKRETAN